MALKLVIFDIDGTLTRTTAVDDACFLRAIEAVFGIRSQDTNWGRFAHVTDRGIAVELVRQHRGWAPSEDELEALSETMCRMLADAANDNPSAFEALAGADVVLESLMGHGAAVGIATGAWRPSAELKLNRAGIGADGVPMSTSDDGFAREAIVMHAISQVTKIHDCEFSKIVYVGDGIWDARAAASLNIPFVARVDNEDELCRFSPLSITAWVSDYRSLTALNDAVDRAQVPATDIESAATTA